MNILFTGRGKSGSWSIRGEQLGKAVGGVAVPQALDVAPYDVAVLVKRPVPDLLSRLRRAHLKIVWDTVDSWPQPVGNAWDKTRSISWLEETFESIRPSGIVAATRAMAADCERFGVPVLALPHHARPGLRRNPIRPMRVVGYEGGTNYLGEWRSVVEAECDARGWIFVVNPQHLADVDVVLALRDSDGYAPRQWKSNVKLANAQGSGTPVICNYECGYMETSCGAELWADTACQLSRAFDVLESVEERRAISDRLFSAAPNLESLAVDYRSWLQSNF